MKIERNTPKSGWRPFTLLLYGMPKVGKSTLASQFSPKGIDGCLIIDTEDGTSELECNCIKVGNLDEFNKALNLAYKSEFMTIAIDTLDQIYHWCESSTVKTLNTKMNTTHTSVEEFGYGLGVAVARNHVLAIINRLHIFKSRGKTVLLVSHQKQATSDTESEKSRTVDLPGKLSRMIAASMDAIGLVFVKKDEDGILHRFISFKPYDQVDAGCRLPELAGKDIEFSFSAIYEELNNRKAGEKHESKPNALAA